MARLRRTLTRITAGLALAAPCALLPGTASAASWADQKADCEKTAFGDPEGAAIAKITDCAYRWASYRPPLKGLKDDLKKKVIAALKRLWAESPSKEDANLAREELKLLGVTELPERAVATAPPKPAAPARVPFSAPEPDKKAIAAADKAFKKGYGLYQKKKYAEALAAYEEMVKVAPGYPNGHYNVACMHALLGDEAKMVEALRKLSDLAAAGHEAAGQQLKQTWVPPEGKEKADPDFDGMRDKSADFKAVTGYAKIKVVNQIPDFDEDNPDNIVKSLKKLGYRPDFKDSDKKPSTKHPVIQYAEHARATAWLLRKLITHPKTEATVFPAEDLGGYDIIVAWSDDVKSEQENSWVADPKKAEKELDDLARQQDELLRKPEEKAEELEEALNKPAEVQENIEEQLKRPGEAIDRTKKSVDKILKPFK
jgi:hypothetical protein